MNELTGIGLGIDAAKLLFGGFQFLRGLSQAKKNQQPMYNIPQNISDNLNMAKTYAQQGLPDAVYNRALGNIDRNQALGLRTMSDRRAGLAGLGGLTAATNDAYSNLAAEDAQARMNNLAQLYNQNQVMAQYKDKQWDFNEYQPFVRRAQEAQALQGAGIQNLFGSLQGASNTLGQQQYYNALSGMGNNQPILNNGKQLSQLDLLSLLNAAYQ